MNTNTTTATNFEDLLAAYVVELQTMHDAYNSVHYPQSWDGVFYETFVPERGRRYVKICRIRAGEKMGSVHCFVEIATGHIYKAATWSAPAKGIRGNVSFERRPVFGSDFYAR